MEHNKISIQGEMYFGNTWAFLKVDDEIIRYYQWFLRRKYHGQLRLHFPKAGAHVTVVRGADIDPVEPDMMQMGKVLHHNKPITAYYNPEVIGFNGEYFWLDIECPELSEIRCVLGLSPHPLYGFHLTIGKLYPEYVPIFATFSDLDHVFDMS